MYEKISNFEKSEIDDSPNSTAGAKESKELDMERSRRKYSLGILIGTFPPLTLLRRDNINVSNMVRSDDCENSARIDHMAIQSLRCGVIYAGTKPSALLTFRARFYSRVRISRPMS